MASCSDSGCPCCCIWCCMTCWRNCIRCCCPEISCSMAQVPRPDWKPRLQSGETDRQPRLRRPSASPPHLLQTSARKRRAPGTIVDTSGSLQPRRSAWSTSTTVAAVVCLRKATRLELLPGSAGHGSAPGGAAATLSWPPWLTVLLPDVVSDCPSTSPGFLVEASEKTQDRAHCSRGHLPRCRPKGCWWLGQSHALPAPRHLFEPKRSLFGSWP